MAHDNPAPPGAPAGPGFIDNLMRLVGRSNAQDLSKLADALLSERGQASGVALADELLSAYASRTTEERIDFLLKLARRFGPDRGRLERAIEATLGQGESRDTFLDTAARLAARLGPPPAARPRTGLIVEP